MANQLLIRIYDVGLGDCIYCRIPHNNGNNDDAFHMLIDCGTWSSAELLIAALKQLETELPRTAGGKRRLDLVVVTHEHKDHIAGFDPKQFDHLEVGAVWMNCAMNPRHEQAKQAHALRGIAEKAMAGLAKLGPNPSPRLSQLMSVYEIDNKGAMTLLRKTLLKGKDPTYVSAGETNATHGVTLPDGAKIHILGPENDFDRFYLGETAAKALRGITAAAGGSTAVVASALASGETLPSPTNVSPATFRLLRSRMQSNALAFAELDGKLKNNSSVVLLIEWRGKRLLFVGDAEWHGDFKNGKMNGSWNVMWNQRKALLDKPVDFLKVGHHGSENATPWDMGSGKPGESVDILNAILPLPKPGKTATAKAVVSTERGKYETIPRCKMLVEIARRIDAPRNYKTALTKFKPKDAADFAKFEEEWFGEAQPTRTDFERLAGATGYVDVTFT
jgi:beta-lactamase superfamily II metal-dependent hydrolase